MSTPALAANSILLGTATLSTDGQNLFLNSLTALLPPGIVLPYAGATAPTGWLLSYGQTVSRVTYSSLFGIIGTTFGAGDGVSTFVLPDLRGNIPAGKDNMGGVAAGRLTTTYIGGTTLGASNGEESHVFDISELPIHHHSVSPIDGGTASVASGGDAVVATASSSVATGDTGSNNPVSKLQPTIILNYIIKY